MVQGDAKVIVSVNHLIRNSLEHLLLFVSVYVYLLQKDGRNFLFYTYSWVKD